MDLTEDLESYDWAVVQFVDLEGEIEISTVPYNWLLLDSHACYWPSKTLDARKFILKRKDPDNSWNVYEYTKILKKTNDYQEAMEYEQLKLNKNDSSFSEVETRLLEKELGRGKRKVKRKQYSDVEDQESDKEPRMTPPPRYNDTTMVLTNINNNVDIIENILIGNSTNLKEQTTTENEDKLILDAAEDMEKKLMALVDEPLTNNNNIGDINDQILKDEKGCVLNQILINTNAIKAMLENQQHFLMELVVSKNNESSRMDFKKLPQKPFNKYKKLIDFDELLRTDNSLQLEMETYFFLLGGSTAKHNIRNGLGKIFTNKLASKCSWRGRGLNKSLENLKIIEVLKGAVRKSFSVTKDKEFQEIVSAWFIQANLRLIREKNKICIHICFKIPYFAITIFCTEAMSLIYCLFLT